LNVVQGLTLAVLIAVVVALVTNRVRPDVAALAGAAVLALTGVVGPADLERGFGSPALLALASLFVIARAFETSGVTALLVGWAGELARSLGRGAVPAIIALCGALSAFLNNTPLVVMAAPVLQLIARRLGVPAQKVLMPLSYAAVLGGGCTLIGTSTNLLVDDMAQRSGQRPFGLFEITGVGLTMALAGAAYLLLVAPRLLPAGDVPAPAHEPPQPGARPWRALASIGVFGAVVGGAFGGLPLAVVAFAGAVGLLLARVVSAEDAIGGLNPQVLLMIAGMLVIGGAVDTTGLAAKATGALASWTGEFGPMAALAALYVLTALATEFLSNAAVAVLLTPVAANMAHNLGLEPRPFTVAVMMAASASFATPFGYQTNALVHQVGRYRYIDFVRVGLPLNLVTGCVALVAIPMFFPFR
jgi:di/tricarboxylate transporter